jgi:hypothetical protein
MTKEELEIFKKLIEQYTEDTVIVATHLEDGIFGITYSGDCFFQDKNTSGIVKITNLHKLK